MASWTGSGYNGPFRVNIWVLPGQVMVPIKRRNWSRKVTAEADGNFDLAKNDQPVNSIREFRMIPGFDHSKETDAIRRELVGANRDIDGA